MPSPLLFITGASSGIGQALARQAYDQGWRLALVARRSAEIQRWAEAGQLDPARYRIYPADVADIDAIVAAGQACMSELGVPDVVVANAGISIGVDLSLAEDLPVLRDLYETNVLAVAATFQPFITPMVLRGSGVLVGVASVAAARGLPGHAGYCGSKAAVVAMCETLRGELQGKGVQVLTLTPGYVATPLTARNRHPMPFLMSAEAFARQALRAIDAGARYRVIPWPMAWVARLLRVLPPAWFDRLLARQPRKHRHNAS